MGMYDKPLFRLLGDRGLLVEYGDVIDPLINDRVRRLGLALEKTPPRGLTEYVGTYCSMIIIYDPGLTSVTMLKQAVRELEENLHAMEAPEPAVIRIPVCYGGEYGPDMGYVAEYNSLGTDEVIRLHSEPLYRIYMLGFTPGYPYLGGLPEQLHTPRLPTPRTLVPAGSVGIANAQTGIYSIASPGGWRLIGRTPVKLFSARRERPILLQTGDFLKFYPISPSEFRDMAQKEEG
ncbi:MAG: 5-oxoprolinase subunit PxpB [Smithellaceae bacterium]|nr:5-oxoprolinase subunit PxpB [Smithellaceae bacterium]